MNLIFIYGPPAAGKLTVALELKKLLGYKVFDNHALIDPIASLFPFDHPELNKIRSRLGAKFRIELFNEAAKAGVDCVTTAARNAPEGHKFLRSVQKAVEEGGGTVLYVQLVASRSTLLERVTNESRRKKGKLGSRDKLEAQLKAEPSFFDTFPDKKHIKIDNTKLSPKEVAQAIIDYYRLEAK